jgi:IS30 family transposase
MRCYSHLSDDERERIGLARTLGHSIGTIAQAIGRPKSTISRELSLNKLDGSINGLFFRVPEIRRHRLLI